MKIAIFHELHQGGARRAVNEIAQVLKKNNDVDLYLVDKEEDKNEKTFFSKIFFYKFIPKKWSGGNWKVKLYKDTVELYQLYKLHKKIAQEIDEKEYDVVFIHPSQFTQAPFLLRFLKTRKVYYCEEPLRIAYESTFKIAAKLNPGKKSYELLNRWIRKYIDKRNISCADIVIANSKHTQGNIKQAYGLKSVVGYLGVNEKIFYPRQLKKDIDVLFIGSQEEIDGYGLFVHTIASMKKKPIVKTHIPGKDWIANDEEFSKLYARSKIVLALSYNEPFGLIPLEAMACGVPVIAMSEGGYKETVVNNKTGYLVSRDAQSLSEKISFLLSHEKERSEMGKNARSHILKHWTWEKRVGELGKLLL